MNCTIINNSNKRNELTDQSIVWLYAKMRNNKKDTYMVSDRNSKKDITNIVHSCVRYDLDMVSVKLSC